MYLPVKLSFPLPWQWLKLLYPKIKNILFRPNIIIGFSCKNIKFTNREDGKISHLPYFCLYIKNTSSKTLRLNAKKIKTNDSLYHNKIFNEIKDHDWWQLWSFVDSETLNFYRENIDSLDNKFFILESGEEKVFPIPISVKAYRIICDVKHHSLLFLKENKIPVEIEINGKTYEYGINFRFACVIFMSHLASDFDIIEFKKKMKQKTASLVNNP